MCRTRRDALASQPLPLSATNPISSSSSTTASPTNFLSSTNTSTVGDRHTSFSSSLNLSSLASLRASLPETPTIYSTAEISKSLAKRFSSSSSYRCSLRGRDVFVLQRPFNGNHKTLPSRLAVVCQSHHRSLVRLLGASVSADHIHLVYDFAPGTSLAACLRPHRNPRFTPLSSWISRMQISTDLAQGIDYIHHHAGGGGSVHNHIKSSAIIVSETGFNAKICHFGAAFLAGDMQRSENRSVKIEGTRGYLAPEVIAGGRVTRKSDVFAFGVVLLELISGDEPLKYRLSAGREKRYECISLIDAAREVFEAVEDGSPATMAVAEERTGRVRRWVDGRLRDSFPVNVAEKMMAVALRCVRVDEAKRPGMNWVEGKISQLFLESKAWSEGISLPAEISASFAPR